MRFHSLLYIVFLAITVAVSWRLPASKRKAWLLLTSYAFYASWHVRYLLLLVGVGTIASVGGHFIDAAEGRARKKRGILVIALLASVLGAFKYLDWALENVNVVVGHAGGNAFRLPHWLLPLGVSFYTFEAIGYTVELVKKKEKRYGFFDFQLFLSFFPHLVAGPIMRAKELIGQFNDESKRTFRLEQFLNGLQNLAIGLFIKNVIVDKLSWEVDAAYAQPIANVGTRDVLSMAVGFAVQIYLDFSAYSRLAIGSGQLFGIELVDNFNYPFRARTPADFWNRWHISLSRWIRDYLFFPLVGKRMNVVRMCVASVVSMIICGLWHGAGYTFLIWGAYHGLLVAGYYVARWALGKMPKRESGEDFFDTRIGGVVSAGLTWTFLLPAWIVFRATSVQQALSLLQVLFTPWAHLHHGGGIAKKPFALMAAIWIAPFVVDFITERTKNASPSGAFAFAIGRGALVGVALVFAILFLGSQTAFVYFQF